MTISLTGSDTAIINNRVMTDFADNNCVEMTFPNDLAQVKTGKNGNSIYALNEMGRQCELKMRLVRGSADDKYMQNLLAQQQANFASTVLMTGQFVKNVGDGQGNITSDTYILSGGVFTKAIEAKTNVEGDTEQSVAMYTMKFANAPRVLT